MLFNVYKFDGRCTLMKIYALCSCEISRVQAVRLSGVACRRKKSGESFMGVIWRFWSGTCRINGERTSVVRRESPYSKYRSIVKYLSTSVLSKRQFLAISFSVLRFFRIFFRSTAESTETLAVSIL